MISNQNTDNLQTKPTPISVEVLQKNLIVSSVRSHPQADVFNVLRTKVLSKMNSHNWNVLALTSPTSGTGKSMIAINLAISIAMEERYSALLVDLDFRQPSIHQYFGISPAKGLTDFFYHDVPLSELLIRTDKIEDLVLLPVGKPISASSDLLSSYKMLNLMDDIKNRYADRIIVIDLPPLLETADAMTFLPKADASILVVAKGKNTVAEVQQSMELIDKDKFLGPIFNTSP